MKLLFQDYLGRILAEAQHTERVNPYLPKGNPARFLPKAIRLENSFLLAQRLLSGLIAACRGEGEEECCRPYRVSGLKVSYPSVAL